MRVCMPVCGANRGLAGGLLPPATIEHVFECDAEGLGQAMFDPHFKLAGVRHLCLWLCLGG